MLNNGQAVIIKDVIDYINNNYSISEIPKVTFDELLVNKDSICLTTTVDAKVTEKMTDVCGMWVSGRLPVSILYRVMLEKKGIKDLDYINIVDTLFNWIKENKTKIFSDRYFIDNIELTEGTSLNTVYEGGTKDFKLNLTIVYERRL